MLFHPNPDLARLAERIQCADAVTSDLLMEVVVDACTRSPAISGHVRTRIGRLVEANAWTDAALALLAAERPRWAVRRLTCDSGEWLCSLSRRPNLPAELDDTVDAHHEVMALAILGALVEAHNRGSEEDAEPPPILPGEHSRVICCDDFA